MTRTEAADLIDAFVDGSVDDPWAWDDFCSLRASDPAIEEARVQCAAARDDYPPPPGSARYCGDEGLRVLRQFARRLRGLR
jgi:hypothetical protein